MKRSVNRSQPWRPTHDDPLFILAMDHRESFGKTLFHVKDDLPTASQRVRMAQAKRLIYRGLAQAAPHLRTGHAGVLVDEQYGQDVVKQASATRSCSRYRSRQAVTSGSSCSGRSRGWITSTM